MPFLGWVGEHPILSVLLVLIVCETIALVARRGRPR